MFEAPKGETLRNSLDSMGLSCLSENEVRKCMYLLLKIVKVLHKKRVLHGEISLDTVMTKRKKKGLEIKLSCFQSAKQI